MPALHTLQALLDCYTIRRELLGDDAAPAGGAAAPAAPAPAATILKGRTVTLVGDLKHGRTVSARSRRVRVRQLLPFAVEAPAPYASRHLCCG